MTFISDQPNFDLGYKHRRLNGRIPTGIFECNSKCKCNHRCSNKVVQNGIQVRLQLFKTGNKGWGIKCLDDIPKGTFICTYEGEILTGEQSDDRGKKLGDVYFADLDFVDLIREEVISNLENEDAEATILYMSINRASRYARPKQNKLNTIVEDEITYELIESDQESNNVHNIGEFKKRENEEQIWTNKKPIFTDPKNPFYIRNYLENHRDCFV
jgi:hypothetical protein